MQRALFRDTMYSLFHRLESTRKRVIGKRQIELLKILLEFDQMTAKELYLKAKGHYTSLEHFDKAIVRDFASLVELGAVNVRMASPEPSADADLFTINLNWPQEIDEGEFLRRMKSMPKGKTFKFLP